MSMQIWTFFLLPFLWMGIPLLATGQSPVEHSWHLTAKAGWTGLGTADLAVEENPHHGLSKGLDWALGVESQWVLNQKQSLSLRLGLLFHQGRFARHINRLISSPRLYLHTEKQAVRTSAWLLPLRFRAKVERHLYFSMGITPQVFQGAQLEITSQTITNIGPFPYYEGSETLRSGQTEHRGPGDYTRWRLNSWLNLRYSLGFGIQLSPLLDLGLEYNAFAIATELIEELYQFDVIGLTQTTYQVNTPSWSIGVSWQLF